MEAPKVCFDKILPRELMQVHRLMSMNTGERTRGIALKGKQWPNGSVITINFMGGTADQQALVRQVAPQWTEHANLRFDFTDDPAALVRVGFDTSDGAWSYVGTDNLNIPRNSATMNLGWVDEAVILHEFGHMIGLSHEHQNPDGGILWNEPVVIQALAGAPNYWSEAETRHNVLNKYSIDQIHGTQFDPQSIMLYAFPSEWTLNGVGTAANQVLSQQDKAFIKAEEMYPNDEGEGITELTVTEAVAASIGGPGEVDEYVFSVENQAEYLLTTFGQSDMFMSLFGPDDNTRLIGENDDGGAGRNAQLLVQLQPGDYRLLVRHYSASSTGDYHVLAAKVSV